MKKMSEERAMTVYIISHSSMDLMSTLGLYESYSKNCDVRIIVSGTEANANFLQKVGIKKDKIIHLLYKTNSTKRELLLFRYIYELYCERKTLDELVKLITANKDNKLIFHSYNFDFHAGYLAATVAKTNYVSLVDVLKLRPRPLPIQSMMNIAAFKLIILLGILYVIFGNFFFISGSHVTPMISLNLKNTKIREVAYDLKWTQHNVLTKYQYKLPKNFKNAALYLHSNPFGVSYDNLKLVQDQVISLLLNNDFSVIIKRHPQSQKIQLSSESNLTEIPSYIPFEFLDLTDVSLVIGVVSTSLLAVLDRPVFSLMDLIYSKNSQYYIDQKPQMLQNPNIVYLSSIEDFQKKIQKIKLKKNSNLDG